VAAQLILLPSSKIISKNGSSGQYTLITQRKIYFKNKVLVQVFPAALELDMLKW